MFEDTDALRIVLADDQAAVRSALRLLLEQEPWFVVVGEAVKANELLEQLQVTHADVLLLDWELPGQPAQQMVELLLDLRSIYPELKVVALSGRPEARRSALEAHVDGFISKCDPPECVLTALDIMTGTIKQRCMPV